MGFNININANVGALVEVERLLEAVGLDALDVMRRSHRESLNEQLQLIAKLVGHGGGGRHLLPYFTTALTYTMHIAMNLCCIFQGRIKNPSPLGSGEDMAEEALTATDTTLLGGSSAT
jgi:hypothetical protein